MFVSQLIPSPRYYPFSSQPDVRLRPFPRNFYKQTHLVRTASGIGSIGIEQLTSEET